MNEDREASKVIEWMTKTRAVVLLVAAVVIAAPAASAPYPPPSNQAKSSATEPSKDGWADFWRTLVGAFAGAGAAFGFNLYLQRRNRRREELAAGNLALLIASRQLVDTLILAKGIHEQRSDALRKDAATPVWAQTHPNHFHFSEALKVNLAPLTFLFSVGHGNAINQLVHGEQLYFDLDSLVQRHAETLQEIQQRIAQANATNSPWPEIERHVGIDLIAKGNTLTQGLLVRTERNPQRYREAIKELRSALQATFPGEKVIEVELDPEIKKL